MLRANYSRNITAAKNAKKKWWERKEDNLKEKSREWQTCHMCDTWLLCSAQREREGRSSEGLWTTKGPNSEKQRQTEDPKMPQETKRCMSNVLIKWKKN